MVTVLDDVTSWWKCVADTRIPREWNQPTRAAQFELNTPTLQSYITEGLV